MNSPNPLIKCSYQFFQIFIDSNKNWEFYGLTISEIERLKAVRGWENNTFGRRGFEAPKLSILVTGFVLKWTPSCSYQQEKQNMDWLEDNCLNPNSTNSSVQQNLRFRLHSYTIIHPPPTTNYLLLLLTAPASQALRLYNYTPTTSQAGKLY